MNYQEFVLKIKKKRHTQCSKVVREKKTSNKITGRITKHTLLVRSSTSVLALERQDLDHRTSFSQASRTALRRSRVGSASDFVGRSGSSGSGEEDGEEIPAQEGRLVSASRTVRNGDFEGKLWNLRLLWLGWDGWDFRAKNGFTADGSNTAAIAETWESECHRARAIEGRGRRTERYRLHSKKMGLAV